MRAEVEIFSRHVRKVWIAVLFAGLVAAATAGAWLRLEDLGGKPMHHDESEQAYTLGKLLDGKGYQYKKEDHHGPVLYYLTAWSCWATGRNALGEVDAAFVRRVPAIAGVALMLVPILWLRRGKGRQPRVSTAAVTTAVALGATSPTAVYYARYFVQETLFALCFWGAVPLLWFALRKPRAQEDDGAAATVFSRTRPVLAALAGALFGGAMALKETWVLMAGAAGAGAVAVLVLDGITGAAWLRARNGRGVDWGGISLTLAIFGGAALVVMTLFFSSFGANPAGIVDSVRTYGGYFDKAFASPHDKPFDWYWTTFFSGAHRYGKTSFILEQYALLGAVAAIVPLFFRKLWRGEERRIGVFSVVSGAALLLIYSVLRYKTPWLVTGILPPLWMASGLAFAGWWRGLSAIARRTPRPWLGGAFLRTFLLLGVLGAAVGQWKSAAFLTSARFSSHERNPLAYVHSTQDVKEIEMQARRVAPFVAAGRDPVFACVFAQEHGPLLWALRAWNPGRQFDEGGRVWVSATAPAKGILPDLPDPPIIITDDTTEAIVAGNLTARYVCLPEVLRPGYTVQLRIRKDLLEKALDAELGR